MGIRELNLTKEQHEWLNGWLELWGAWVYSGRLEKRMSSVIAKFMESVEPGRVIRCAVKPRSSGRGYKARFSD